MEEVYTPPKWINNSRRDCTPLPSGEIIHGGIVQPSNENKKFTEGLHTPPKWRNNSRRKCTPLPSG